MVEMLQNVCRGIAIAIFILPFKHQSLIKNLMKESALETGVQ
jgi:hypothetical protein